MLFKDQNLSLRLFDGRGLFLISACFSLVAHSQSASEYQSLECQYQMIIIAPLLADIPTIIYPSTGYLYVELPVSVVP